MVDFCEWNWAGYSHRSCIRGGALVGRLRGGMRMVWILFTRMAVVFSLRRDVLIVGAVRNSMSDRFSGEGFGKLFPDRWRGKQVRREGEGPRSVL